MRANVICCYQTITHFITYSDPPGTPGTIALAKEVGIEQFHPLHLPFSSAFFNRVSTDLDCRNTGRGSGGAIGGSRAVMVSVQTLLASSASQWCLVVITNVDYETSVL